MGTDASAEAVAGRAVFEAITAGDLAYFAPVASTSACADRTSVSRVKRLRGCARSWSALPSRIWPRMRFIIGVLLNRSFNLLRGRERLS